MGDEFLFQGDEPMFLQNYGTLGSPSRPPVFHYTASSGEIRALENGSIYVMNDSGKTVATYRFVEENSLQSQLG